MNYMTTTTPPSNAERLADWAQKAWLSGYDFVTGPKKLLQLPKQEFSLKESSK